MSLQFRYGGYLHDADEVAVKQQVATQSVPARLAYDRVVRWTVSGKIINVTGTVGEMALKQGLLEAAYAANGLDAVLTDLSTGQPYMQLTDAGSYSGVTVVQPPSFPVGDGSEIVAVRTYEIVLEASYEIPGAPELIDFREVLKMWGGGPLVTWVECVTGAPEKQILKEQTTFKATQSGYAVGRLFRPVSPPPLFPGFEIVQPEYEVTSAARFGKALRDNRVAWSYSFMSGAPLVGVPNQWPAI